ncbi:MAG TPA: sodium:proton antiporter [bacterium]|nr:sodium:proton antiporter [bacterium]
MIYFFVFLLFAIGLYGVCCKRNIVKMIVGFTLLDYSVFLFLIMIGYRKDGQAPILDRKSLLDVFVKQSVDPLPQALVLTAIVIGLAVTALMVALAVRIYERYGTFDITNIKKLKG